MTTKAISGRWAVVVKDTGEVSDIKLMRHGLEPELRNDQKDRYELVELDDDTVAVGMVRGGAGKGGFSWPEGHENETQGAGAVRLDQGDKSRGTEVPAEAKAPEPTPQPEDMKRKPRAEEPAKPAIQPKPVTQAKAVVPAQTRKAAAR